MPWHTWHLAGWHGGNPPETLDIAAYGYSKGRGFHKTLLRWDPSAAQQAEKTGDSVSEPSVEQIMPVRHNHNACLLACIRAEALHTSYWCIYHIIMHILRSAVREHVQYLNTCEHNT